MRREDAKGPSKRAEGDGRVQRSVRSRGRILDALCELVERGNLRPTGQQVAEHAGVSLRTVFRHFDDMESLYREMNARIERVVRPILELEAPTTGTLAERIRAVTRRRVALFEKAGPFLRSGAIHRWQSSFLAETHAAEVRALREDLLRALPEAKELPAPRREAMELVLSFEAYDRLRSDQRLGRARVQEVMREALLALLRK